MHFVLDQNFPDLALRIPWPPQIQISALRQVEPELTRDHEDWEILIALSKRGDIDGFITNDAKMLDQPRTMVALSKTRLVLIVTDESGHQPLRATALLMLHIEEVVKRIQARTGPAYNRLPASLEYSPTWPGWRSGTIRRRRARSGRMVP